MQFTKLPTHLSERLISKICLKNFTISELILTMIFNDDFRVQLFNLKIEEVGRYCLNFNREETSLDSLQFDNDKMIKKFEKLIIDGCISIELFITGDTTNFDVLFKYSKRCDFICKNDNDSVEKKAEYVFDPRILSMDVSSNALQCFDDRFKLMSVNVKINMKVKYALEYLNKLIKSRMTLQKYRFFFDLEHTLEMNNEESVDKMVSEFEMFDNFLKTHKIKVDNLKIDLTVIFNPGRHTSLTMLTSSDYFVKKIKKVNLCNARSGKRCYKYDYIKNFEYMETLNFEGFDFIGYSTLGSLRRMKYLKEIDFSSANVDFSFLSKGLPKKIEKIKIFQTKDFRYPFSTFVIPSSLKILKITTHKNRKNDNFEKFDFTYAVNLSQIHLIESSIVRFEIVIKGLKKVPKNLKYILYFDNFSPWNPEQSIRIFGNSMDGIYSNINKNNRNLWLVRN